MAVEAFVDIIEASQHSMFEARDVVFNIKNLGSYLGSYCAESRRHLSADFGKLPIHSIKSEGQGLMQVYKAGQDIFAFRRSIRRHLCFLHVADW